MSWWGKVVGGAFGYMLGGPIGALLGAAFGHQFDRGLSQYGTWEGYVSQGGRERTQTAFFTALFSVMGHLAKSDGRVTEDEIAMAKAMMQQMQLNDEQAKVAIRLFNEGKADGFDLDGVLAQFRQECQRRRSLVQMFMELLIHAAYADGKMHPNEKHLLEHVSDTLGFTRLQFRQLEAMVKAQRTFQQGGRAGGYQQSRTESRHDVLAEAYQVIGVAASATDAEVKKAYRRLMNQHHPDKLVAKGMPEEMVKLATEKSQEIRAAYDTIRDARGMN